ITSAASRPTGGRDSGAFSTLTASAGRFGTEPPVTPVRGHVGGGGGGGGGECGGVGEALGAAVLLAVWLQPVITTAVASATPIHRHARHPILSIGGFLLFGDRPPGFTGAGAHDCSAPDAGEKICCLFRSVGAHSLA